MSENFHGGSLDVGTTAANNHDPANNVIELNNLNHLFFLGPKKTTSEDFGSLDSSDTTTYLSCCNTHPFPSQGSLAGLELLAAQGSMAANGSINNSVYVNPFDPGRGGGGRGGRENRRGGGQTSSPPPPPSSKAVMTSWSSTTSPRGSPQRRVRIAATSSSRRLRSRSSDLCNDDDNDDMNLMDRETGMEYRDDDDCPPKHRRIRKSQVGSLFFFVCEHCSGVSFLFVAFSYWDAA